MNDIERRALIGAAGIGAIAALSKAGPLNPPAGAVASTGRTTDEIYNKINALPAVGGFDGRTPIAGGTSSVTISAAGSYVLTGNITVAGTCLTITGDGVCIDLNGFTLTSTGTTLSVVNCSGARTRFTLRNGRLFGGLKGIGVTGGGPSNMLFEDLVISSPKTTGIGLNFAGGTTCVVRRCTVMDVGATTTAADGNLNLDGITLAGGNCRIEECSVSGMTYNGGAVPTYRGITFSSSAPTGAGNHVTRCCVSNDTALTGEGIRFFGTGVYRDNTVMNFSTAYIGGTNGGGNV